MDGYLYRLPSAFILQEGFGFRLRDVQGHKVDRRIGQQVAAAWSILRASKAVENGAWGFRLEAGAYSAQEPFEIFSGEAGVNLSLGNGGVCRWRTKPALA